LYNPCHDIHKLGVTASFCDFPANRYSCPMKIWFARSTNVSDSSRPFQVNGSLLASIRFSWHFTQTWYINGCDLGWKILIRRWYRTKFWWIDIFLGIFDLHWE
jgi:hypothetical protein